MGLNEAMDLFNMTLKSVDNILGQGENPQELYNQIRTVLIRIIRNKFKLSRIKFSIGTKINFGGYVIKAKKVDKQKNYQKATTDVTICPNPQKIKAIQNLLKLNLCPF